ncbi:MAG: hypothetical protein Q4F97_03725 [Bacteroidales bacterium]|nr:hypothetical protein [Bacteroidales bacterium]
MYQSQNVFGLINYGATWALIENILLSSTAENLGCAIHVPVGKEDSTFHSLLNVPDNYTLPAIIGIGFPDENAQTPTQVSATIEEKVHWEKW